MDKELDAIDYCLELTSYKGTEEAWKAVSVVVNSPMSRDWKPNMIVQTRWPS